jgi:hypothetical protein
LFDSIASGEFLAIIALIEAKHHRQKQSFQHQGKAFVENLNRK